MRTMDIETMPMTDEENEHLMPITEKYGIPIAAIIFVWREVKFSQHRDLTVQQFAYESRKTLAIWKARKVPSDSFLGWLFFCWQINPMNRLTGT